MGAPPRPGTAAERGLSSSAGRMAHRIGLARRKRRVAVKGADVWRDAMDNPPRAQRTARGGDHHAPGRQLERAARRGAVQPRDGRRERRAAGGAHRAVGALPAGKPGPSRVDA